MKRSFFVYQRLGWLAALIIGIGLTLAGCPPMGTDNPQSGDGDSQVNDTNGQNDGSDIGPPDYDTLPEDNNQPIYDSTGLAKPTAIPPMPTPGAMALMNEIRFAPLAGDAPFVELLAKPGADLSGLMLFNESGGEVTIASGIADTNGLFLVVFGAAEAPDNGISMAETFLAPASGWVELRAVDRVTVLDRVAWGIDQPDNVRLYTGGGAGPEEIIPGFSLNRRPSETNRYPLAWTPYAEAYVTPGAPNYLPAVDTLIPPDGTEMVIDEQVYTWYAVDGATSYHVQIATDADFQNLVVDEIVVDTDLNPGLAVGEYFWRVQAIMADDTESDFSPVNRFKISTEITFEEFAAADPNATTEKQNVAQANQAKIIGHELKNFPRESQRKDSPMLLLESNQKSGPHAWNTEHSGYDRNDPADAMNCTLASVKMINHYYGGTLSQDRIGYEIHKDDDKSGPETDLNYNEGNWPEKAVKFAIGVDLDAKYRHKRQFPSYQIMWREIITEINAGRPVLIVSTNGRTTHTRVVVGWLIDRTVNPAQAKLIIHDPGNPKSKSAQRYDREFYATARTLVAYFRIPAGKAIKGVKQEASVTNDTDNDMVYDFDETNRFMTDINLKDSDGDCLNDFEEIKRSVFDELHGYGHYTNTGHGDKSARQLDPRPEKTIDYDGGGLSDALEDWNRDGETGSGDSDPYDPMDDDRKITGTFERFKYWYSTPDQLNDIRDKVTVTLESQADGGFKGTMTLVMSDHREAMLTNSDENCPQPRQWTQDMTPVTLSGPVVGEIMCSENTNLPLYLSITAEPQLANVSSPFTIVDECYGASNGTLTLFPFDSFGTDHTQGSITPTGKGSLKIQYTPANADAPLPYGTTSNIRLKWDVSITGK